MTLEVVHRHEKLEPDSGVECRPRLWHRFLWSRFLERVSGALDFTVDMQLCVAIISYTLVMSLIRTENRRITQVILADKNTR